MTQYLFLDGGCLRARLRDFAERHCPGGQLSIDWARATQDYTKVFYYDALPVRRPKQAQSDFEAESQAVAELHAHLANIDRFRVNEGDTRYRSGGRGIEQKKVDVMIAVDMMIHTIRRNMSSATLLAGDADFTPLLNALSNEGMFVTLLHPPRASKDLLAAADARHKLTAQLIGNWLDEPSRKTVGALPKPSTHSLPSDQNCVQIFRHDNLFVFHQLVEDEIWVAWPNERGNQFFCMRGGSWKNTRLIAEEDYGVELPETLPAQYAHL